MTGVPAAAAWEESAQPHLLLSHTTRNTNRKKHTDTTEPSQKSQILK